MGEIVGFESTSLPRRKGAVMGAASAVVFIAGLGGCTQGASTGPSGTDGGAPAARDMARPAEPLAPSVEFSTTQLGLDTSAVSDSFDFAELRDLWVRVKVPGMPRVTKVELRFANPQGEVVNETLLAYSPDPKMEPMMMGNVVHPMTIFTAKAIPGGYALDYPIPVAGTMFTRYVASGRGTWTVQAKVDGVPTLLMKSLVVKFGSPVDE